MSSPESSDVSDIDVTEARQLIHKINRKNKKPAGGFQAMGLSEDVLRGISKKGYVGPTPIQRRSIPIILSGRDVVAMARTGSGKTAAFLIPLLERLKNHQDTGARALLLSPTRELAMQTLSFIREIGRYTNLVAAVVVGGDKMEDQFAALHQNPDVIVATPGRLLHVIMEMNLTLRSIEFVVFDEGDRLFEMGFADQLRETLHRLPSKRQTLIFSATLPSALLEFAQAGLTEPALIRLDVDKKLSEQLKMAFVTCLPYEKEALLLHILETIIPPNEKVVIFFSTKHHVDCMELLLCEYGIDCAVVHSGLDPVARNMAVRNFRHGSTRCLLVTDLAARGIDVPLLDNVINFHFPAQPKLFVHRVGRVARAGRSGMAISIVDSEELPYLLDLFVFLGRQVITSHLDTKTDAVAELSADWPNELLGSCPRDLISVKVENVAKREHENASLRAAVTVCNRATKKYATTRPKASVESVKRSKELRLDMATLMPHPIFASQLANVDLKKEAILEKLRSRKLPTIFEALGKTANPEAFDMMQRKRAFCDSFISQNAVKVESKRAKLRAYEEQQLAKAKATQSRTDEEEVAEVAPAAGSTYFVPIAKADDVTEQGLSLRSAVPDAGVGNFLLSAEAARLDVQADEVGLSYGRPAGSKKMQQVWDRKKKKFVNADVATGTANIARIKTESGVSIPASYKTDAYKTWLKKNKPDMETLGKSADTDSNEGPGSSTGGKKGNANFTSLFNARYGSVVEFMDVEEDGDGAGKFHQPRWMRRKTNKQSRGDPSDDQGETDGRGHGRNSDSKGIKVVGTMSRFRRTLQNAAKKRALKENKGIKRAKGSRTFGQLRKPEQILKQRRRKHRENQRRLKNLAKKGSGKKARR